MPAVVDGDVYGSWRILTDWNPTLYGKPVEEIREIRNRDGRYIGIVYKVSDGWVTAVDSKPLVFASRFRNEIRRYGN